AVAIANDLRQSDTVLFAEPAVRFPLQTVQRIQQRASAADHLLNGLRPARNGVWSINAQAEQFLINGRGNSPKPTWTCNLNSDRPRLDGVLDDRTWKNAQSVPLTSAQKDDSDWPAKAWIASDGEFLYLAVECTRIPKQLYPAAEQVRKRDSDLSSSDRVEVLLDIDRDCFVGYRLAIDYRGLTAESCWNDSSWNPTWYVGSAIQETTWTAEAAIPLKELTPEAPAAKTVWNVGVQRVVPQLGLQSWTVPAAVDPLLSGCGMLVFE
ncbi:MAG: sugar-binding protein, partial [Planctomycetota bacterium]|nr:sugar-binding protein [Planctomycetota bacterium]